MFNYILFRGESNKREKYYKNIIFFKDSKVSCEKVFKFRFRKSKVLKLI